MSERNVLPACSGLRYAKQSRSKQQLLFICSSLKVGGGSMFLQNFGEFILGCMVSHAIINPKPNTRYSSFLPVSVLMHWTRDDRKNNSFSAVYVEEEEEVIFQCCEM
jgi:hypothetical protein